MIFVIKYDYIGCLNTTVVNTQTNWILVFVIYAYRYSYTVVISTQDSVTILNSFTLYNKMYLKYYFRNHIGHNVL